jgi:hypothetical protein
MLSILALCFLFENPEIPDNIPFFVTRYPRELENRQTARRLEKPMWRLQLSLATYLTKPKFCQAGKLFWQVVKEIMAFATLSISPI